MSAGRGTVDGAIRKGFAMRTSLRYPVLVSAAACLVLSVMGPRSASALTSYTIGLHNATAQTGNDCPAAPGAYWHFVITPNNGNFDFTEMDLSLTGVGLFHVTNAMIINNGAQADNVFVKVPAGSSLTSLNVGGSVASYTSANDQQATNWTLSTTCPGQVDVTTTTTTTTTTLPSSTTTTTLPSSTTTTTTTTLPSSATTTTLPSSATTTTLPSSTTTTIVAAAGPVPSTGDEVASATVPPGTSPVGASQPGTLPATGGSPDSALMFAGFAALVGAAMLLARRTRLS
jgi:LPXTG-motif cell wall-anchored protein